MSERWLIVADDLTGAADCAIAFAKRGLNTVVGWGDADRADAGAAVHAFDANSRGLGAAAAHARHRTLLKTLFRPERGLVKKIDSTLRGQPAAEIAATRAIVQDRTGAAFGVLAPAFPATGRTVENGRVRVDGNRLEDTDLWRRDHSYPTASLPDMLASTGLRSTLIGLATVRAGDDALRDALHSAAVEGIDIAICDAVTAADLERVARATLAVRRDRFRSGGLFWIGSAGIAHALASTCPVASTPPPVVQGRRGGILVVVGSLAAVSRSAARRLTELDAVQHIPLEPDILLAPSQGATRKGILKEIIAALVSGRDVLVDICADGDPDLSRAPRIADALADLLTGAAEWTGGIIATGGETAAALLGRFGVDGLRLIDEIEPGVSLGQTLGRIEVPIITKSGAFGTNETLTRCVGRLRDILERGVVR